MISNYRVIFFNRASPENAFRLHPPPLSQMPRLARYEQKAVEPYQLRIQP